MSKLNLVIILPLAAWFAAINWTGGRPWWALFWLAWAGYSSWLAVRGKPTASENAEMKLSEIPLARALFLVAAIYSFVLLGLFDLDKVPWVLPTWLGSVALISLVWERLSRNRAMNAPSP